MLSVIKWQNISYYVQPVFTVIDKIHSLKTMLNYLNNMFYNSQYFQYLPPWDANTAQTVAYTFKKNMESDPHILLQACLIIFPGSRIRPDVIRQFPVIFPPKDIFHGITQDYSDCFAISKSQECHKLYIQTMPIFFHLVQNMLVWMCDASCRSGAT